jgi:uncharacterized membrane protein YccC
MSIVESRDNNPIDREAQNENEIISHLLDRIEDLEAALDDERQQRRDQIHAVAREHHEERNRADRYRKAQRKKHERIDEQIGETHIEEPPSTIELHEERLDTLADSIEKVRRQSSDDEPGGNDGETPLYRPETPIERLFDDPDTSGIRITESVSRALTVAGHFDQWSQRVQGKQVITQNIRTMVNTALGESLSWKQVHRACHKLEELTNGIIEFRNSDRHGRMLVLEKTSWLSELSRVVSEGNRG